jgi:Protein of unknown function (DUF2997)
MAKLITCVVEDDGSVTADATGFAGKGCVETIAKLLSILGGETISAGHKPEYHQNVVAETRIKAGR